MHGACPSPALGSLGTKASPAVHILVPVAVKARDPTSSPSDHQRV